MKRFLTLFLICILLCSSAFASANTYKRQMIHEMIESFSDMNDEDTIYNCRYDAESDTLALTIQMDFDYDLYLQMPDYLLDDLKVGYGKMSQILRETVVDIGLSEINTVVCAVTNDDFPFALYVNTIDVLHIL